MFALQNWQQVYYSYLHFNTETKLKKRDLQLWKPLLVLAAIIDKKKLLPNVISFAERISSQRKSDLLGEGTLDYKLLSCLNSLFPAENDKIYVNTIRFKFNSIYSGQSDAGFNKTISTHLDKLGFKELRDKDRYGSFYNVDKKVFDEIVSPLTNDFLIEPSQPSHSSQDKGKGKEKCDEDETNVMKGDCDECDEKDECDGSLDSDEKLEVEVEKI